MSPVPELITLETDRLALRRQAVGDAVIFRRLWMERDVRVPPHRQIDVGGHPTVADIAAQISEAQRASRPGLLTVERKDVPGVLGYCGLVFHDTPYVAVCSPCETSEHRRPPAPGSLLQLSQTGNAALC